ncbi:CobW family GTP-binding protein [Paenibacillus gansuensis]|uniref:CobW family GTP-binding protein n=1 Tax=Paenibacillus gansuensis TaxID=306542 RepID=A0ABW5PCA4_9BACL
MKIESTEVYLLTGFLGSGKTTLLGRMLDYFVETGKKAAVLMNELGEVNLDGMLLGEEVPMKELLSGCICCTVRGDFGFQLHRLLEEHAPDVVIVESTGAANPMEVLDELSELSLYTGVELKDVIAVADALQLQEAAQKGKGPTYRLMKDQLRCASVIILNKTDLIPSQQLPTIQKLLREWNPAAPAVVTVRCSADLEQLLSGDAVHPEPGSMQEKGGEPRSSHNHVLVYTQELDKPVNSESFEAMFENMPEQVYRAKGIVSFTDTSKRYLFQYAYRQLEFTPITPQGKVKDVAVFIGEHFDKQEIRKRVHELM